MNAVYLEITDINTLSTQHMNCTIKQQYPKQNIILQQSQYVLVKKQTILKSIRPDKIINIFFFKLFP